MLLQELKKEYNLKQSDIAKGIKAHNMTLSNVENRNIISIKTFFSLLNFFNKKGISAPEIINKMMNDKFIFLNKLIDEQKLINNKELINFFQKADKIKKDTDSQIDNSVRIMKLCFTQ